MKDKLKKILASSLAVLTIVGTSPMIVASADTGTKEYKYKNGVTTFDYSKIQYHGSSEHHNLPEYYETDKNLSNPELEEARFERLQAPGMQLNSTEVNKHWECNDIVGEKGGDGAGNIIWDPATATLTLDNVDFGKLSYRHDQSLNHANAALDIAAIDPDDTVTIVIKGKNTYVPILQESLNSHPEHQFTEDNKSEQVMISANCNVIIKAEDEDASLEIQAYNIFRGTENSSPAILVWDYEKNTTHNLTIDGGTYILKDFKNYNAIYAKTVNITGGANVTTEAGSVSIYSDNGVTITNSIVNATSTGDAAIFARNGKITINSGTVTATAAEGKPAMIARTSGITDTSTTPKDAIILGEKMSYLNHVVGTTNLIKDNSGDAYHTDTVFVPVGTEVPLTDTKKAPNKVTVAYNPVLELTDDAGSLDVQQDGSDKVLTGDNLLDSESASGSKVGDIKKNFESVSGGYEIIIVNNKDSELSDTDPVGTGSKIELVKDDVVVDSITVIVKGDVDGDGKIDVSDATNMLNAISGVRDNFEGVYEKASLLDKDDTLTVADVVKLLNITKNVNA